ncbi:MAG: hypothetical protein Q9219_001105 [cf. Caloplaca sp. 3 TL-2023]
MAPLRNNRSSHRSGRSQIDHDVFEGLPVRHWRKTSVAISTALQKDESTTSPAKETLFVELAMPRDAQLLSPLSQALLRAARSGEITKKASLQPLLEDDKENAEDDDAVPNVELGFMAKRWAAVPRHLEGPELEFLAKRRKGLPSVYTDSVGQANGPIPMRKARVKKIDGGGNTTILDVLIPEGQTVEGEVVEEEADVTQAPAPGTIVEGVGVANAEGVIVAGKQPLPTPPRRRPPPPKRKAKGPGRGRKKKVAFAPESERLDLPQPTAAVTDSSDGIRRQPEGGSGDGAVDVDVTMDDVDALQNGEDSSEEDEEGDDGDEGDREEGELSPSPPSLKPQTRPEPKDCSLELPLKQDHLAVDDQHLNESSKIDPHISEVAMNRGASSSPDLPLAAEQEMAVLSTLSKPLDDRTSAAASEQAILSVEEPPTIAEQLPTEAQAPVVAAIPLEHNPLEGLAEPSVVDTNHHPPGSEAPVSDGEVDLLGSLEKQLNRNEIIVNGSAQQGYGSA